METPDLKQAILFTHFGLCPEYKIMEVEGEWVEFHTPPEIIPLWGKLPDTSIPYIETSRLHLVTHLVEMSNGSTLSARFAVSHKNKIIFLQVSPISGEFGKLSQEMMKYYG
jgi:hypothetical protein